MKCPNCGADQRQRQILDETLTYDGQSLTLHKMESTHCPQCDEAVWSAESYRRYTEARAALIRSVKGDTGEEIRRIRKKLKLTQTELAAKFGVGKIAFSRYERGETKPPAPVVKLLKRLRDLQTLILKVSKFGSGFNDYKSRSSV